jgi:hypothetical protein
MKKKFFTSIAVTFVMAAALVAVAPTNAQAAKAINVKVGEKTTIKASKKVTWSIKDTSIATINKKSGKKVKLTGVKEGSTILTTTDASGKKLDYAVNVKAAAETAPAATNKLQEFANYVKSKGKVEYKRNVSVQNNWQKMKAVKWGWNYAGKIKLGDGKEYKVIYRPGVENKDHDLHVVYTITADSNNLYFKRTSTFEEFDWRYINTTNYAPDDPTSRPSWASDWTDWDPKEFNENRYYIFGTTRDNETLTVTVPLNGNAAKAEFAHNFDYDFYKGVGLTFPNDLVVSYSHNAYNNENPYLWKKGAGSTGAWYSHWVYNFNKAAYLTNAAYSWDVDKDSHDYLANTTFWFAVAGNLNQFDWAKNAGAVGPNASVWLSESLNSMLNVMDNIMKDNGTGFTLKSIGFDNFTNSDGHYYTNEEAQIAAVYTAAWANIAFY